MDFNGLAQSIIADVLENGSPFPKFPFGILDKDYREKMRKKTDMEKALFYPLNQSKNLDSTQLLSIPISIVLPQSSHTSPALMLPSPAANLFPLPSPARSMFGFHRAHSAAEKTAA